MLAKMMCLLMCYSRLWDVKARMSVSSIRCSCSLSLWLYANIELISLDKVSHLITHAACATNLTEASAASPLTPATPVLLRHSEA